MTVTLVTSGVLLYLLLGLWVLRSLFWPHDPLPPWPKGLAGFLLRLVAVLGWPLLAVFSVGMKKGRT